LNKAAWGSFWILGFIWGSSFLLIRVGVEEVSATQLVLVRTVIAAIGLNIVRHLRGKSLPRDWATIRAFAIIGVGNATLPYTLISLSEQNISSGLAAVLQSTASLFTLVVAHFVFADERINMQKIIGLVVGFGGIIILSSGAIEGGEINTSFLLGQFGMMGASLCYAIFTVYSRTVIRKQIEPVVIASGTFISSAIFAVLFVFIEPLLGGRSWVSFGALDTDVLLAIFGLGLLNTFIAYLFFYFIVQQLGAFRASMVTYIIPAVGLFLGWLILDEKIELYMIFGAALIVTGIGIVNLHYDLLRRASSKPVEAT
jgi:drug/metabolite transporter (DMT)-like permease